MAYPLGVWVENPVGYPAGSIMYSGPVLFPAGTDTSTQVGVAIFGPNGATTNFPAVQAGASGLSPIITASLVQVAYGTALPTPNPAVTLVTPGGPGVASVYNMVFYLNAGAPGTTSAFQLQNATDLSGTAVTGWGPVVTGTSPTTFGYAPQLGSGLYYSVTGGSATSSTVASPKNLTAIGIAAKPYAWWPVCKLQAQVVGAADTRVDVVARLTSTTGQIVGYGLGQAGVSPAPAILHEQGLAATGPQIVPAGTAATIYFNAENQTSSVNAWSVAAGWFASVKVTPVPTT